MNIEYNYDKICNEWDGFVNKIKGDVLQTSAWGNYEFIYHNWRPVRFFVKSENTIIAGCQIFIINDFIFGNVGLILAGPCFINKTSELMVLVVKELKKTISVFNLSYLMIQPNYKEHDLIPFLESEEFKPKISYLPPFIYHSVSPYTLFLDLNLSNENLLKQMNENRRRGIKKGLKSPFKVKLGHREDLKTFYDLYNYTVTRQNYTNPTTGKVISMLPIISSDEFEYMWNELYPFGWIKLFLGTVEDETICGALTFPFGNTFQYQLWGWNGKYSEYKISDVMQWEMIQWAKNNGFQIYDFCEIDNDIAKVIRSGEPIPDSFKEKFFYGPTVFKLQFGGNIIEYPKMYACYSEKLKHIIETSKEDLTNLIKLYKDFYWGAKNFSNDHQVNFFKNLKVK